MPSLTFLLPVLFMALACLALSHRSRPRRSRFGASKLGVSLVLGAWCLVLSPSPARADDTSPSSSSSSTTQDPAPPKPSANAADNQPARKEEEDETARKAAEKAKGREGFFARTWAGATGKTADELTSLRADNERLTRENERLTAENAAQAQQLAYLDENWPAIEAALTQGKADAPALQTPFGKKVADLSLRTTASQMAATGHDPKKLPGPGADKPDTGRGSASADSDAKAPVFGTRDFAAVSSAFWASRPPAKSSSN